MKRMGRVPDVGKAVVWIWKRIAAEAGMKRIIVLFVVIMALPTVSAYAAFSTSRRFVVRNWKAEIPSLTPAPSPSPAPTDEVETVEQPPDGEPTTPAPTDDVETEEMGEQGEEPEEVEDVEPVEQGGEQGEEVETVEPPVIDTVEEDGEPTEQDEPEEIETEKPVEDEGVE